MPAQNLSLLLPSKEAIAANFGDNAHLYDDVAVAQRRIAARVCEMLICAVTEHHQKYCSKQNEVKAIITPRRILDAGCGTGYIGEYLHSQSSIKHLLKANLCQVEALDISAAMLAKAAHDNNYAAYIEGDIEALPFQDHTFHYAISSLAMQWCHDFTQGFEELLRVTKKSVSPNIFVSTLLDGTFYELRKAFAMVDNEEHILPFMPEESAKAIAKTYGGSLTVFDEVVTFESLKSLFASIRKVGASSLANRRKGLLGRIGYRKIEQYFQTLGQYQLTYRVAILVL